MTAYRISRTIPGLVRVEVLDEHEAKGDVELLNLPCGRGARTPEQKQAAREVRQGLNATYAGALTGPLKVVKVKENGGGLIGASVVCMTGDHDCERHLTSEPYIEAIGRHDDYYRYVLRDYTTTAGGIVLRATVEVAIQERPTAYIVARVRVGNDPSHLMFDDLDFDRIPRSAFHPPTIQVIRQRRPTANIGPPLPLSIYLPPRLYLPPGCKEYSLAA